MPRRPTARKATAARSPRTPTLADITDVRVVVDPNETAPLYYVNYMEVGHTGHDFTLFGVRLPPKISEDKKADVMTTKELHVEPEVVISIPLGMIAGLIRALTTQKEAFEKLIGEKIQEPGEPKE
jgi:hypothetical protein